MSQPYCSDLVGPKKLERNKASGYRFPGTNAKELNDARPTKELGPAWWDEREFCSLPVNRKYPDSAELVEQIPMVKRTGDETEAGMPRLLDGIRVKAIVNQRIGTKSASPPRGKETRYSPRVRICSGISFGNSWRQNRTIQCLFHEQEVLSWGFRRDLAVSSRTAIALSPILLTGSFSPSRPLRMNVLFVRPL